MDVISALPAYDPHKRPASGRHSAPPESLAVSTPPRSGLVTPVISPDKKLSQEHREDTVTPPPGIIITDEGAEPTTPDRIGFAHPSPPMSPITVGDTEPATPDPQVATPTAPSKGAAPLSSGWKKVKAALPKIRAAENFKTPEFKTRMAEEAAIAKARRSSLVGAAIQRRDSMLAGKAQARKMSMENSALAAPTKARVARRSTVQWRPSTQVSEDQSKEVALASLKEFIEELTDELKQVLKKEIAAAGGEITFLKRQHDQIHHMNLKLHGMTQNRIDRLVGTEVSPKEYQRISQSIMESVNELRSQIAQDSEIELYKFLTEKLSEYRPVFEAVLKDRVKGTTIEKLLADKSLSEQEIDAILQQLHQIADKETQDKNPSKAVSGRTLGREVKAHQAGVKRIQDFNTCHFETFKELSKGLSSARDAVTDLMRQINDNGRIGIRRGSIEDAALNLLQSAGPDADISQFVDAFHYYSQVLKAHGFRPTFEVEAGSQDDPFQSFDAVEHAFNWLYKSVLGKSNSDPNNRPPELFGTLHTFHSFSKDGVPVDKELDVSTHSGLIRVDEIQDNMPIQALITGQADQAEYVTDRNGVNVAQVIRERHFQHLPDSPNQILISVRRFNADSLGLNGTKSDARIKFKWSDVILVPYQYSDGPNPAPLSYKRAHIKSVAAHYGSLKGGHHQHYRSPQFGGRQLSDSEIEQIEYGLTYVVLEVTDELVLTPAGIEAQNASNPISSDAEGWSGTTPLSDDPVTVNGGVRVARLAAESCSAAARSEFVDPFGLGPDDIEFV